MPRLSGRDASRPTPRAPVDLPGRRADPPGGRKPWALLTYLLLEDRPPTRRDVAGRLEPEANDPLAALRWLLHQARRAVEPEVQIEERNGRLHIHLDDGVDVDVLRLLAVPNDVHEIETLFAGELLEGMEFDDAPLYEVNWQDA